MYGIRLKELRKEKGWTIEETANKLNIGRSTYAGYENEFRKPSINMLIQLSNLFNSSVDYIIGLTNERDIKKVESNASEYLKKSDLNWDGVPLTEDVLRPIRDILEIITRDRLPNR